MSCAFHTEQSIGLVIPMFNEANRWNQGYWEKVVSIKNVSVLFVNDGSSDLTAQILSGFIKNHEGVKQLNLLTNKGKSEAVRLGMLAIAEDVLPEFTWIGYMDGDGAFDPSELSQFLASFGNDFPQNVSAKDEIPLSVWMSRVALSGRRIHRRQSRHYLSRVLISLLGFFVEQMPYDSQCGLKLFRNTPEIHESLHKPFRTRWFFDLEILLRMRQAYRAINVIREEPLEYWRDVRGSKVVLKQYPRIMFEIFYVIKIGIRDKKVRRNQS